MLVQRGRWTVSVMRLNRWLWPAWERHDATCGVLSLGPFIVTYLRRPACP